MRRTLMALCCVGIAAGCAFARVINIPDDRQTIQSGLDDAQNGDTVLVHPGEYQENLSFPDRRIVLGSLVLIDGDPAHIAETIIDGGGNGRVINFTAGDDHAKQIHGLTIRNGSADSGAGLFCQGCGVVTLNDLIIEGNEARQYGGGIWIRGATLLILRTIFRDNSAFERGAFIVQQGNLDIYRSRITGNSAFFGAAGTIFGRFHARWIIVDGNAARIGGGLIFWNSDTDDPFTLDHVTITRNRDENDFGSGAYIASPEQGSIEARISNSIIWDNSGPELRAGGDIDMRRIGRDEADACRLVVSYCDVEGGEDGMRTDEGGEISIGDGMIDADPLFVDPENGDYHLTEDSPCIDAGDPDADPDPDWSRADMGAYPFIHGGAFIGGRLSDAVTDEPVEGAEVIAVDLMIGEVPVHYSARSNGEGVWGGWLNRVFEDTIRFEATVNAAGYSIAWLDTTIAPGDSIFIETPLVHPDFRISADSLFAAVDSGGSGRFALTLVNDGAGPVQWRSEGLAAGEAGSARFTIRKEITASEVTGDDRIQGVAYCDGRYYLSGSNAEEPSQIYILDEAGALLDSFPQPGESRYGMKDLEWGDGLLWGSGENVFYGVDVTGELRRRIRSPYDPTNNIAFDPDRSILWISGTATNFSAIDFDGNLLRTHPRNGFRTYGLGWFANDPDDCQLYILHDPGDDLPQIHKMNAGTGDTLFVGDVPNIVEPSGVGGLAIFNDFDRYRGWAMAYTLNRPPDAGGDQLVVVQLDPNREWLTIEPSSGVIEDGEQVGIEVVIRTEGIDDRWSFDIGEYDGVIRFHHNAPGLMTELPVHLVVAPPNTADVVSPEIPSAFGIRDVSPNPFNSAMRISLSLPDVGEARLSLFGVDGRYVATLFDGGLPAGESAIGWRADGLPGGLYLIRLEAGGARDCQKALLLR